MLKQKILSTQLLYLISIITLALLLRIPGLLIPFIGRHGWNEALYASVVVDFITNKRSYPYIVQFNRPDFNLGPLLYLMATPFVLIFGIKEWAFRLPIIICSIINVVLIYMICKVFSHDRGTALLASLFYSVLPLATYYGVRFQHEELMFVFYLMSVYFIMMYLDKKLKLYLYVSLFSLGVSTFLVKQSFISFVPAYLITIMYTDWDKKKVSLFKLLVLLTACFLLPLIFLLTAMALLVPPELEPYKFYLNRIICGVITRVIHGGLPPGIASNTIKSVNVYTKMIESFVLAFGILGIPLIAYAPFAFLRFKNTSANDTRDKGKRLFLSLNLLTGLLAIYLIRFHIGVHDYYYYLITLPIVLAGALFIRRTLMIMSRFINYILAKNEKKNLSINKEKISNIFSLIIVLIVIFASVCPSYLDYHSYRDAFAQVTAINTGFYIRNITDNSDVIIVQSPVMGFYALRPHLTWNYLWILNLTYLHKLRLCECEPILKVISVYNPTTDDFQLIKVFKYWNPTVVVISPDVSSIFIRYHSKFEPFLKYFNIFYTKRKVIPPYTIFVKKKNIKFVFNSSKTLSLILTYVNGHKELVLLYKGAPLVSLSVYFSDDLKKSLFDNSTSVFYDENNSVVHLENSLGYSNFTISPTNKKELSQSNINIEVLCFSKSSNVIKIIIDPQMECQVSTNNGKYYINFNNINVSLSLESENNFNNILIGSNKAIVIKNSGARLLIINMNLHVVSDK